MCLCVRQQQLQKDSSLKLSPLPACFASGGAKDGRAPSAHVSPKASVPHVEGPETEGLPLL